MKTAAVFSDNMVLQRGVPIRIFGTCSGTEREITVCIPELSVSAYAVISGGCWEAVLPPVSECSKCTVEISCGAVKIVYRNIAVGEVWLAGGQSNMEFELHNDIHGKEELKNCSRENVRFYYTPKCSMTDDELLRSEAESRWSEASENNSGAWSAAGYYFAKELSRKLGVTVGIIGCNWGGTSASAWLEREYLVRDERLRPYIEDYEEAIAGKSAEEMIAEYNDYRQKQDEWDANAEKCYAEDPDMSWEEVLKRCGENPYSGPPGIKNPMRPCGLYETMVKRVCPYTIAGVLWYQGESDDHRPAVYSALLTALIDNWRTIWHNDKLPFIIVQLPMFRYSHEEDTRRWAMIRDEQMKVFNTVKNTGIAVASDCGELDNIHPKDKSQIGHRLYLQALSEVYSIADRSETLPPLFRDFYAVKGGIMLRFDNCSGFEVRGELSGFEIAADDGIFVPANAEIHGNEIFVRTCIRVRNIRYKWLNYADIELFGTNGLPVPPFMA